MTKISEGPDGERFAFTDLPVEAFPVKITAHLDNRDGEVLWETIITPYVMARIPASTDETAGRIHLHFLYGDGQEAWTEPASVEESEAYIQERIRESQ